MYSVTRVGRFVNNINILNLNCIALIRSKLLKSRRLNIFNIIINIIIIIIKFKKLSILKNIYRFDLKDKI